MMAKHIVIERPNGVVTMVRSELETPSETPLTEHEEIINELYSKVKNLGLFSVVFNEADNICKTCNKPIRMQNGILQQLCECNSEVEVLPMENCPKCEKLCTGRSCHDCQQYW